MHEELWTDVFPWPTDRPLRKPRFGVTPPPKAEPLPKPGLSHDASGPRPPYLLTWSDESLGLDVVVEQRGDDLEIQAHSASPDHVGKAVSVAFVSESDGRMKRLTVELTQATDTGSHGRHSFGSIAELRREVGDAPRLVVFFLT